VVTIDQKRICQGRSNEAAASADENMH
jgi:hypothetical protein